MKWVVGWLCIILLVACNKETAIDVPSVDEVEWQLNLPNHFPQPEIPGNNKLTQSRVELGRKLFFDPVLSRNNTISCSSCHEPRLAFAKPEVISPGVEGRLGFRNAPTLTNVAYNKSFMWDGGPNSLENQAVLPFDDHNEFDLNILDAEQKLRTDSVYIGLFKQAYNSLPSAKYLVFALSCYQRTLISGNSLYDQEFYLGKQGSMSEEAKKGKELFFGERLNCSKCHVGFNFTNNQFENNGVYANGADSGRMRVTLVESDRGKFKVPTLRNVSHTAPYMHDGSLKSLNDVIDHYSSGGTGNQYQSDLVKGFMISENERKQLIAFLNALTDHEFIGKHHRH